MMSISLVLFRDLDRLPGDKTYCEKFRKIHPYQRDSWFLDIIDTEVMDFLMSHMDARHNYVSGLNGKKFNVMIDFGRA